MARIRIQDIMHTEELNQDKMKGIIGGAEKPGGWGSMLQKGAGMAGEMIGGEAGGALLGSMDGGITSMDDWEAPSA